MPKLFAHYGAGHVSLIMAVCWTPWLIVCAQAILNNRVDRSVRFYTKIREYILPGFVFSGIMLADIRWIGFAGLLWVAYFLTGWALRKKEEKVEDNKLLDGTPQSIIGLVRNISVPIVVAIGLASPFLLPFMDTSDYQQEAPYTCR
jgi:hypothetical protein